MGKKHEGQDQRGADPDRSFSKDPSGRPMKREIPQSVEDMRKHRLVLVHRYKREMAEGEQCSRGGKMQFW